MLFFDPRDRAVSPLGRQRIQWLVKFGARPVHEARQDEAGYVFAGDRGIDDYRRLVASRPRLTDSAEVRASTQDLGRIVERLAATNVPTPKTWRLELDAALPDDIAFPLFVRTTRTSWKLGGAAGRVRNMKELESECDELRRSYGWNATILARQWIDFAAAGGWRRGRVPQEIRVWIVDGRPVAWSFHHMHIIPEPRGFPPRESDLEQLAGYAASIGRLCAGRLIVADFARDRGGAWWLIEADNGSAAGTAHEAVYRAVAVALNGTATNWCPDALGGPLRDPIEEEVVGWQERAKEILQGELGKVSDVRADDRDLVRVFLPAWLGTISPRSEGGFTIRIAWLRSKEPVLRSHTTAHGRSVEWAAKTLATLLRGLDRS